jgi:hypothetical protein
MPVFIVCDPARFGDDDAVIFLMEGTNILERFVYPQSRTTFLSGKINQLSIANNDCPCVVENVNPSGVCDELVGYGRKVIEFNPSEKANNSEKYYNKRAEAWWTASEMLSKCDIYCPDMPDELKQELTVPNYDFRNGKILIDDKEEIKKVLGRSPNHADAYVIGLWALKYALSGYGHNTGLSLTEIKRLQEQYN